MATKYSVQPIPLQEFDISLLTKSFQALNKEGLERPCYIIRLINDSNRCVMVSYDGRTVHDVVRAEREVEIRGSSQLDLHHMGVGFMPPETILYVKGSPGGSGTLYLAGYYFMPGR